jgi:hypothetical protein
VNQLWVRETGGWQPLPVVTSVPEAPNDGASYGRANQSWAQVLPISGGTLTGPLLGSLTIGAASLNALTITPGSANTNPVAFTQSGTVGYTFDRGVTVPSLSMSNGAGSWYGNQLNVGSATGANSFVIINGNDGASNRPYFGFQTAGFNRWRFRIINADAAGGVGSDLSFDYYNGDPGATGALTNLFTAHRNGSGITFTAPVVLPASATGVTQTTGNNTASLATTAFVANAVVAGSGGGIPDAPSDSTVYGRENAAWVGVLPVTGGTLSGSLTVTGNITIEASGISYAGFAGANLVAFEWSGNFIRMHVDNTDQGLIASQGWVASVYAPIASPTFTGTVTLAADPTAALGASTKQYVDNHLVQPSTTAPPMDGTASAGAAGLYARGDHVHPSDTSRLSLGGGTLTGALILAADPTTALGAVTKQYVDAATGTAAVTSWNSRIGAVVMNNADVIAVLPSSNTAPLMNGAAAPGTGTTWSRTDHVHPSDATLAPLASPSFTGTVTTAGLTATGTVSGAGFTALLTPYALSTNLPAGSTTTPVMNGTAAVGTSLAFARGDHVHPSDTSRAAVVNPHFSAGLFETSVAVAASAIDLNTGSWFTKTAAAALTWTVANVPAAAVVASFVLELINGGAFTQTWWANLRWAGGSAPTLTASGKDVLGFYTLDGGSNWNGLLLGKAMA